jgi:hypothetical protein
MNTSPKTFMMTSNNIFKTSEKYNKMARSPFNNARDNGSSLVAIDLKTNE